MAKSRQELAEASEYRKEKAIRELAESMPNDGHLTIWAEVRKRIDPDASPADVWRAVMSDHSINFDPKRSVFVRSTKQEA